MIKLKKLRQKGFTIIELMIATSVLATILVTVSIIMISIGNLYYKGINQARVQDGTRSIADEISQRLQLSGLPPKQPAAPDPNGTNAYCIGTTRYTYVIGVQIGTNGPGAPSPSPIPFQHVLWRDTIQSADTCQVATLTAANPSQGSDVGNSDAKDGSELMVPNSRLINFSITPLSSPYTLALGIAYGDDDLLCSPSVPASCATTTAMTALSNYTHGDLLCKGNAGDQFCSTSDLSTTVVQRLTSN